MNLKMFKKCALLLPPSISVILRGKHGIGKTESVRDVGKELNLPLIERRFSQMSEGDLIGLPKITEEYTDFKPPKWFLDAVNNPCILFIDEFDRASNELKQAGMELILERSIMGRKVHEETRIYAAINGGKNANDYDVTTLDPAICDRFWIADIEPTKSEWLIWAKDKVHPYIYEFIVNNDEWLDHKGPIVNDYEIMVSRRSWDRLSKTMIFMEKYFDQSNIEAERQVNFTKNTFKEIARGFVGTDVLPSFMLACKEYGDSISCFQVINDFDKYKERIKNLPVARMNYLIDEIQNYAASKENGPINSKQMGNIVSFFYVLPAELKATMHEKMTMTTNNIPIETAREWTSIVYQTILELLGC